MEQEIIDKLKTRIDRLNEVGQQSFLGNDFSFGFDRWKLGTIILLEGVLPKEKRITASIAALKVHRIDFDEITAAAHTVEKVKGEAAEILQTLIETIQPRVTRSEDDFWHLLHPFVVELAKTKFEQGHHADAVLACLREGNTILKNHLVNKLGKEYDGADLINVSFSPKNPIITLADLSTEDGRNIQLGYMEIFRGMMIGIRNPKSHKNYDLEKKKAIHFLFMASFLFIKLEENHLINLA